MLTYEDIVREEGMEEVMRVLPETDWTQPVAGLKPLRDSLYSAFGVERVVSRACWLAARLHAYHMLRCLMAHGSLAGWLAVPVRL